MKVESPTRTHADRIPTLESDVGKRMLDFTGALLGLVVLSPLIAGCMLLIRLGSRGPIFFRQTRVGYRGRPFTMFKLRTMVVNADELLEDVLHLSVHEDRRLYKIAGDPRVTPVGRLLRRFSLDELPQLWNVLRGDMSLVGPRPLIPEEDRHVTGPSTVRRGARPGLTGPWQISGRNDLSFDEMMELDRAYVVECSWGRDLRLLVRTLPTLLRNQRAG